MVNTFIRKFILLLFIIIAVLCEIKTSEVPRPRGVSLSRVPLYAVGKEFVCLDGSLTIQFTQVNDDYCDCPDGSDEPGTSACPAGMFYCTNAGHKPLNIPSSRVNDGICDCCDASDEYANPNSNCVNNCNELGRSARAEAQREAELIKLGSQIRADLSQKGILLKQEKKEKLLVLNRNKNDAEQVKKEKEALKKEAEELETLALQQYKHVEEEHTIEKQAADEEEEEEEENVDSTRRDALDAFNRFDSNQDGKLEISELQTRPTFDRNRDGQITEEEARFFLDEHAELDFEQFLTFAWPKIKPFIMLESGLFKPLKQEATEAGDLQEDAEEIAEEDPELDEHDEDTDEADAEDDEEVDVEQQPPPPPPEKKESEANLPQYDEETQKIIEQANTARQQYNEAEQALRSIQSEIRNIEESLQKDYGPDEEFAALDGQCFEYTDREYVYKLCPFNEVTQRPKAGGAETRLGSWGSWTGADPGRHQAMLYERGQSCWNGPQRSVHVRVLCGGEDAVTNVAEPNRCEYTLDFSTPAACNPALVDKSSEDTHDEL